MAATSSWANLGRDMLSSIADAAGDGLSLGHYARLRGVCTGWRSALAPPSPILLGLADGGRRAPVHASVFSLPERRTFRHLYMGRSCALNDSLYEPVYSHASIIGSGSGRLAVAIHSKKDIIGQYWTKRIFLLHPGSVEEAELRPPSRAYDHRVRKVVFAPNLPGGGPKDWPAAVALYGRDKVAYVDASHATRSKQWTTIDIPYKAEEPPERLVDLAFDAGGENVYCVDMRGVVRVLRVPRYRGQKKHDPAVVAPRPILVAGNVAPPYEVAAMRNPSKHIFFCDGRLYQVWRRRDEILVLRFTPGRRPCWGAVKDLGGCSVFVAENSNAAVVRGVGGVKPDSVYWIDNVRPCRAMVHDVATGTYEVYCANKGNCWYVDDGSVTISIDHKNK